MPRFHDIDIDPVRIRPLLQRAGVVRAHLFGSLLTPNFRPDSDIDILIEADPMHPPSVLALGGLQVELSEMLGRHVHITQLSRVPIGDRTTLIAQAWLIAAP